MEIKLHRFDVQDIDYRELQPLQGDLKILEDENYKRLKKSISEKGLFLPIFVWKKGKEFFILDGHGREKFFKKENAIFLDEKGKKTHKIPCLLVKAKDEKDAKEKVLLISSQYQTITEKGFRDFTQGMDAPWLEQTTFFDALKNAQKEEEEEKTDEDDLPIESPAIVKPGELWRLGEHKLFCGDATHPKAFDLLMEGSKANLIFTDPPYGVDYQAAEPGRANKKLSNIANDKLTGDALTKFLSSVFSQAVKHAEDEAAFYIWHPNINREAFFMAMKAAGIVEKQYLLWIKTLHVSGSEDYQWQHEPCFYASKDGCDPKFYGTRNNFSVWNVALKKKAGITYTIGKGLVLSGGVSKIFVKEKAPNTSKFRTVRVEEGQQIAVQNIDHEDGSCWYVKRDYGMSHPTQKPVELSRRAIANSSQAGDIVLDPFLGSGSTLLGAEATGRRCYGIELDPKYCDLILKRWQDFTKKKAVKAATFKPKGGS